MRRALACLAALALWLAPPNARADEVDACVRSADRAQQLRDQGKLIEARAQLIACGASACPAPVAKQCGKWLQGVEAELPTLSLRVRDAKGDDVADVAVTSDGAPLLASLDGRPVPMDPGVHRLAFRRGSSTAQESIVVRAGEKDRLVDVQLSAPTPSAPKIVVAPPRAPPPRAEAGARFRFPWPAGVALGFGVAGFVTMGALAASANADASSLRQTCAPNCAESDVDVVRTKLAVANVGLGVGIAGVAVAAIWIVVASVHHARAPSAVALSPFGVAGSF